MSIDSVNDSKSLLAEPIVGKAIVMILSMLGLVLHNAREFGVAALSALETGTIPMLIIGIALIVIWGQVPKTRSIVMVMMIGYAGLNLIGGGVLSVLPLPFLPFEPEQSLPHYLSHILYGALQLPLIWLGMRHLLKRDVPLSVKR